MKDVAACEKLRGAGKRALIRRYPNGETRRKRKALAPEVSGQLAVDSKGERQAAKPAFVVTDN